MIFNIVGHIFFYKCAYYTIKSPILLDLERKNFLKIFLRSISLYKENEDFVGYNLTAAVQLAHGRDTSKTRRVRTA